MRNLFIRRWQVEKIRPTGGQIFLGMGMVIPGFEKQFWTHKGAVAYRDRMNLGMEVLKSTHRFRLIRLP